MGKYAKGIVAVLTAALVSLSTFVAPDTTAGKVVAVGLAVLGAVGVIMIPNKSAQPPAA